MTLAAHEGQNCLQVLLQGFSVADFLASVQAAADKAAREGAGGS